MEEKIGTRSPKEAGKDPIERFLCFEEWIYIG
jgi:hypothetical protein